jgi:rhodanese-related sulfurtransferase
MNNLKLPNPKMMDVAVPANTRIGPSQGEVARRGWAATTTEFANALDRSDVAIVDIRDRSEQEKEGKVPGAVHVPYATLADSLRPQGVLHQTALVKKLIFVCTFGERSAMAVQLAQAVGLHRTRHLHGGLAEWRARNQSLAAMVCSCPPIDSLSDGCCTVFARVTDTARE